MSRLRKVLDPTRTGKDAESLERTLLKLVVGQDEAVEQIVNIYQMHVTGLSGRPGQAKPGRSKRRRKLSFTIPVQ